MHLPPETRNRLLKTGDDLRGTVRDVKTGGKTGDKLREWVRRYLPCEIAEFYTLLTVCFCELTAGGFGHFSLCLSRLCPLESEAMLVAFYLFSFYLKYPQ